MQITTTVVVSVDVPAALQAAWKALSEQHNVTVAGLKLVEPDGRSYGVSRGATVNLAVTGQPLTGTFGFSEYDRSYTEEGGLPAPRTAELQSDAPAYVRAIVDALVDNGFTVRGVQSDEDGNVAVLDLQIRTDNTGKLLSYVRLAW